MHVWLTGARWAPLYERSAAPAGFALRPPAVILLTLEGVSVVAAGHVWLGVYQLTVCPEFGPGEPRMTSLMQMLRTSVGTAETSLRVITEQ